MRDRTFLGVIAVAVLVLVALVAFAGTADGAPQPNSLFVQEQGDTDGVVYLPTKITPGGTFHYETDNTNPSQAYLNNHVLGDLVWTGNGSEHLPCEGGIHWIANKNVLTISNCLEAPPTTTTSPVETTTTTELSTTTTTPVASSTTTPETSSTTTETTVPSTSTLPPPTSPPTSPPVDQDGPSELPYTGLSRTTLLALLAAGLVSVGSVLAFTNREEE